MNYRSSLTEWPQTDHHTVGMIGGFLLLEKKRNLMTLDRLSILANISRYTYHLDVAKLIEEHPDISYTACIIALVFANGDLSLVTNRTLNISFLGRMKYSGWRQAMIQSILAAVMGTP